MCIWSTRWLTIHVYTRELTIVDWVFSLRMRLELDGDDECSGSGMWSRGSILQTKMLVTVWDCESIKISGIKSSRFSPVVVLLDEFLDFHILVHGGWWVFCIVFAVEISPPLYMSPSLLPKVNNVSVVDGVFVYVIIKPSSEMHLDLS